MSILVLNRKPNASGAFYEWLQDAKEPIVMLCDHAYRDRVDHRYEVLEFFPDWTVNGNIERRAIELHERYQFRTILALSESEIVRAAKLREILGIEGQSVESATAFRDKVVMKTILQEAGINLPAFQEVLHPADLIAFCHAHGFPVVYKPADGAGSEHTDVLYAWGDVEKALQTTAFKRFEVETFVEGDMCHVDGVFAEGEIKFASASKYINGCLSFQVGEYLGSYIVGDELRNRLIAFAERVLRALPTSGPIPFHAEIFHTPNDDLVFCEVASRPGGGRVVETVETAYGYSIRKHAARAMCSLPYEAAAERQRFAGFLLIPPRIGVLEEVPHEVPLEGVVEYITNAKAGDNFATPTRSVDHYCSVIVVGDTEKEVKERIHATAEWIERNTRWKMEKQVAK